MPIQTEKKIVALMENKNANTQFAAKDLPSWTKQKKRSLKSKTVLAAASFCLCGGIAYSVYKPENTKAVLSSLTAGFEYDETLGRLQFVSNVLPESAMVFLSNDYSVVSDMRAPADAEIIHAWNQAEPWLEYAHVGGVSACQDGTVMTVVKNHQDLYTVRILHKNGYESVYSGLHSVHLNECDEVLSGEAIGTAVGFAAFELRKDGLSVFPTFL